MTGRACRTQAAADITAAVTAAGLARCGGRPACWRSDPSQQSPCAGWGIQQRRALHTTALRPPSRLQGSGKLLPSFQLVRSTSAACWQCHADGHWPGHARPPPHTVASRLSNPAQTCMPWHAVPCGQGLTSSSCSRRHTGQPSIPGPLLGQSPSWISTTPVQASAGRALRKG